jgi:hypothetical protein
MVRCGWFLSILVTVATCVGFTGKADACSCRVGPRKNAFETSAAVFEGQVTAIALKPKPSGFPGEIASVSLTVIQAWKGIRTQQVTVLTPASASECGVSFQLGKNYLIYAAASEGSELIVSACSRTREISKAETDIQAMGKGSVPADPKRTREISKAETDIQATGKGSVPADPKRTSEEKVVVSEPRASPPKPAGSAGCQVGAPGGLLPPAISAMWLGVCLFFWHFLRKRGAAL